MKRHYKFYLFTACAIAFSGSITANSVIKAPTAVKMDITSNWVVIESSNGIITSLKQGLLNGEKVFYVKFENKNSQKVNFSWSLATAKGEALNKTQNATVESGAIMEASTKNDTMIIVVPKETAFQNTIITINLK